MPRPHAHLCLVLVLLAAACSSPTAPTPSTPPAETPSRPVLTLSCPATVIATSTAGTSVPVTFAAPSASGGVAPIQVSCTRESGSPFAVGSTSVECTARDAAAETAACTFTVIVNAIPRLARTRFLAFGDSLTEGEVPIPTSTRTSDGLPNFRLIISPTAAYPTQLTSMLRARYTAQTTSISVVNAGRSGEWAEDGAKRLPGVISTVRPEVILLLHGGNELRALGRPGVARASAAVDLMAKHARARQARLFLATLPPPLPTGTSAADRSLVTSLNSLIRRTAIGEGAFLVDVYSGVMEDIPRYMSADGIHPTEAGYRKIAELFLDAIRQDLEIR